MAANSQADLPEDKQTIDTPHSYQHVLLKTPGAEGLDMSVVVKAETAIEKISSEFPDWMSQEIGKLRSKREEIRARGLTDENAQEFFFLLHNVRGQAATLGFPLVGQVAGSLCEVIQHVPAGDIPKDVIENHIDAILAIVNEKASGNGNAVAQKLVARLCGVTKEYLDYMLTKNA